MVSEAGNISDVFVRTGENKNPLSIIFDKIGDLKIEKDDEDDEEVDEGRELLQSVAEDLLGLVEQFETGNLSSTRLVRNRCLELLVSFGKNFRRIFSFLKSILNLPRILNLN